MTVTLVIARHGNTFEDGETPRRVGSRTDLPLTEKGRSQARALGLWLRAQNLIPDMAYCSELKRTSETAEIALQATDATGPIIKKLKIFNEIDYGPDENKPEDEVVARIGAAALKDWEDKALVPPGWHADPDAIIRNWTDFARALCDVNKTCLVVTSNGIARFAPHITGDFESFRACHGLKLATGALGVLIFDGSSWRVESWNARPPL